MGEVFDVLAVDEEYERVKMDGPVGRVELKSRNGGACTLGDLRRFVALAQMAAAPDEAVVAVQTPDLPMRSGTLGLAAAWRTSGG